MLLLAFSAGAPPASAASFPCAKASAPDEIAICTHPDLNDSDVEMATRYQMLLALLPMGGAGALRDDQKAWLQGRQACGGNVACLRSAYAARIGALKSQFQQIVSRGPY
ncbi:lysozyme inhibitor LprI family protein [Kaistia dalseonensis]|nr:lysozyme inhibitor LprI family protein [Kaistia dalseonensis]MCX5495572.1 lysozyme inhibitor LprI family protein [Kaistia dalseonensis]